MPSAEVPDPGELVTLYESGAANQFLVYGNVDDRLLKTDFTQLPSEIMMSSVALSMTESLFGDLP